LISKNAIIEFESKKINNWDYIKTIDRNFLEEEFSHISNGFKFKIEPYDHQLACILLGYYNPSFLFLLSMGTGKSAIIIHLAKLRKQFGKVKKTLVLMPNIAVVGSWIDEINKQSDLSSVALIGTKAERELAIKKEADLYLMNYAGLQVMMTDTVNKKRIPNLKKMKDFADIFDAVVFDEIHNCSNKNSLVSKLSLILSKNCKYRYGLTGTPFNRDLMGLWNIFNVIDHGKTLGHNITLYRSIYFDQKINYWGGYEYNLKKNIEHKLYKRIKNISIRYSEDECMDLPPIIRKKISLSFPNENYKYYIKAIKDVIEAKGDFKALKNAFVQLRQISSGFIGFKNEEEEKMRISFDSNPKLETLISLINEINDKVIVFNEFIYSGDIIAERLKKEKIKFVRLYGGTKKKIDVIKKFQNDPKIKVFVINSISGGTGLNLQCSKYGIFYESNPSVIVRSQAEKRFSGARQKKRSFIFDLVMKKSVEEKILKFHSEGKDLFRAIVEGKEKFE